MYRGDDRTWLVTLTTVVNGEITSWGLSGMSLRWTAKRKATDSDDDAVIKLTSDNGDLWGDVIELSNGQVHVTIPASATDGLTAETKLVWDLQMVNGFSGEIRTVPDPNLKGPRYGTLLIKVDITRTVP
jgi:hypothetical protein